MTIAIMLTAFITIGAVKTAQASALQTLVGITLIAVAAIGAITVINFTGAP